MIIQTIALTSDSALSKKTQETLNYFKQILDTGFNTVY